VDLGRTSPGPRLRITPQEEKQNDSQQLWQKDDCKGIFSLHVWVSVVSHLVLSLRFIRVVELMA